MKKIITAIMIVLMLSLAAQADEGNGGYAGAFLQVPIGARPTALGGAYTAVSNDAAGALYNPAGLVMITRPLVGTSYRFLQLDRKLGYVTAVFPVRGNSVLGGSWLYAGSGSVMTRDKDGMPLGEEISQTNMAFSILFAKRFEDYISAGMKASYLHATMAHLNSFSIAISAGLMVQVNEWLGREKKDRFPIQDLQFGLSIKNMGSKYLWNSQNLPAELGGGQYSYEQQDLIPIEVGLGTSGRLFKKKLLFAADVTKNTKQAVDPRVGIEYSLVPQFALRVGYGDKRLAAGTGYVFAIGKKTLAIDYAFSADRADEGSEHIFSFDFLF